MDSGLVTHHVLLKEVSFNKVAKLEPLGLRELKFVSFMNVNYTHVDWSNFKC